MGSVPGADLTTALTAGVLAPLVHLACARIALGIGWRRGYMREGFLHGMILGPLGLLTTFALRKRSRPSEWIREEYQRLSRDPAGVLFFTAAALFSAALAVGYGLAAFRIAGGLVLAAPSLRLKGHYLAMASLGFGELMSLTFREADTFTGGVNGFSGIPFPALGSFEFRTPQQLYWLVWGAVGVAVLLAANITSGRPGRAMRAIHGSELGALASVGFYAAATTGALIGISMPIYWLGLMLMMVFTYELRVLPAFGAAGLDAEFLPGPARLLDAIRHLVLPVATLTIIGVGGIARFVRGAMLDAARGVLAADPGCRIACVTVVPPAR